MKPSPYARIPRDPRWYAQAAEYQKGPPTLGAAKENTMQILWCKDLGEGVFEKGSGAPCRRCGAPAWMHWTVRP